MQNYVLISELPKKIVLLLKFFQNYPPIRQKPQRMEHRVTATVTKSTGSWYNVLVEESGSMIRCRLRGSLRLAGSRSTNPVVVGDRVVVEYTSEDDAAIVEILPRRNYIIRRASNLSKESHVLAANIDMVYVVITAAHPHTSPEFIDRVLVTAEAYQIPATLIINKIDIDAGAQFREIYEQAGYPVLGISATEGVGIEELKIQMSGRTSLLTGNSGVGKSTLINAIDPTIKARVGEISDYHHKGMHTTTFSEIFPLHSGGYIIDTPGIKGFGLVDLDKSELCRYFPDLMHFAPECGYYNCTHTHEPRCAVMAAYEQGLVSQSRYESYLRMQEDDGKHR